MHLYIIQFKVNDRYYEYKGMASHYQDAIDLVKRVVAGAEILGCIWDKEYNLKHNETIHHTPS